MRSFQQAIQSDWSYERNLLKAEQWDTTFSEVIVLEFQRIRERINQFFQEENFMRGKFLDIEKKIQEMDIRFKSIFQSYTWNAQYKARLQLEEELWREIAGILLTLIDLYEYFWASDELENMRWSIHQNLLTSMKFRFEDIDLWESYWYTILSNRHGIKLVVTQLVLGPKVITKFFSTPPLNQTK